MASGIIQVPPDSTGKKVDAASLDVGLNSVMRQRIVIADNSATAGFATVTGGALNITGDVQVLGTVQVSAAAAFPIDTISATVVVAGTIVLGAGTANFGTLDGISKTVAVSLATPFVINNISATVNVAILSGTNNIGGVSLVAGTANIGSINNISATVITSVSTFLDFSASTSVRVGDSANSALRVNIVAGAAAGGTSMVDRDPFAEDTGVFTPVGGVFADVSRSAIAEDVASVFRITNQAAIHANLRTDGGVAMDDSTNSALRVNIVAGAAAGVSQNDGTPFTAQAAAFIPIGGVFDDVAPDTLSEGDAGVARMTTNRALHINLRAADGTALGDASATGLFIRTATITLAAGAANIGTVNNISATVQVAIGTPFTVNNISATVNTVVGAGTNNIGGVSLVAGTANIGFINNISATVQVAIGTPFTVNNISATVNAVIGAGVANIGFINNISATVIVAGTVALGTGTANIGSINNISRTVEVAIGTPFTVNNISATVIVTVATPFTLNNISATVIVAVANAYVFAEPSASHGPRLTNVSVSTGATCVPSPGAGNAVFITMIAASNRGTTNTLARIGTSASIEAVAMFLASAGGGFVMHFDPPWKLSASERAICSCKPNVDKVAFNINYYVGTA